MDIFANSKAARPLRAVCTVVLAGALFVPAGSAWAVTSEEKQAEADAIFAQIDAIQTQLNRA